MVTVSEVWAALEEVKDPEIPAVSVVELGIINEVQADGQKVTVVMTPTFVGCPAVNWMRDAIRERIAALGVPEVNVQISFDPPWTSNRITPIGRRKLREFGFAPPQPHTSTIDLIQILPAECPHCGATDTVLESPFGPTLCRAIHYCNACRQSFEQFKSL